MDKRKRKYVYQVLVQCYESIGKEREMSIYSDYKAGAMNEEEFKNACARADRIERYYEAREEYLKANDYDEEREDDYDGN